MFCECCGRDKELRHLLEKLENVLNKHVHLYWWERPVIRI